MVDSPFTYFLHLVAFDRDLRVLQARINLCNKELLALEAEEKKTNQALEDAKHQALYLSELLRAVETPEPRRLRLVESHGSF